MVQNSTKKTNLIYSIALKDLLLEVSKAAWLINMVAAWLINLSFHNRFLLKLSVCY